MMNLRYSRQFVTSLRHLAYDDKQAVIHALEAFQEIPLDPSLKNHALTGRMSGKRAFSVAHDLRVVFTERGNCEDVTLLDAGGHAGVYLQ
jgi:mRNA-degrading endonuclease YafQ of YafQ-DinJ toxin-antitoxin module